MQFYSGDSNGPIPDYLWQKFPDSTDRAIYYPKLISRWQHQLVHRAPTQIHYRDRYGGPRLLIIVKIYHKRYYFYIYENQ